MQELSCVESWRDYGDGTGKYRIIYLIDEKDNAVAFLDVGLRKVIYK